MLFMAYPLAAPAAKVEYHARDELGPIEVPDASQINWGEAGSPHQSPVVNTTLNPLQSSLSPTSRTGEVNRDPKTDETEQNTGQQTTGTVLTTSNAVELTIHNDETAGLWDAGPQIHFDLISSSQELLSNIIDNDDILEAIVEDTLNLAQQINNAWNDLDDQLTRELFQGLGYLGVANVFYHGENLYNKRTSTDFKDNPYAPGLISETDNYVEPDGFFGFILKLPKLLTLNNLMLVMAILLTANGLFRIMRFILLRI